MLLVECKSNLKLPTWHHTFTNTQTKLKFQVTTVYTLSSRHLFIKVKLKLYTTIYIKQRRHRRSKEKIINLPSPLGSNQRYVIASVQSDKRVDISKTSVVQLLTNVLSLRGSKSKMKMLGARCRPTTLHWTMGYVNSSDDVE